LRDLPPAVLPVRTGGVLGIAEPPMAVPGAPARKPL